MASTTFPASIRSPRFFHGTVLYSTVQDSTVDWRRLLPAMTPRGTLTVYFNPDRDGDLKARLKAVGEAQAGAYGRVSESDIGRRMLLERLAEVERQLGIGDRQRTRRGAARGKQKAV